MHPDEPRDRLEYRGGAPSRVKQLALKALVAIGGALMVASAFVLSLVFLAVGLVVVLTVGGYLWWQTRELRKQMRARMQARSPPPATGEVIEGEVIRTNEAGRERRL
jgi:uncharacterized protein HemX